MYLYYFEFCMWFFFNAKCSVKNYTFSTFFFFSKIIGWHCHYWDIDLYLICLNSSRKSLNRNNSCTIHIPSFHRCLLQLGTSADVLQNRAIVALLANGYWRGNLVSLAMFRQLESALPRRPLKNESLPQGRLSQGRGGACVKTPNWDFFFFSCT